MSRRKLQISNPQPYTPPQHFEGGTLPAALQPVMVPHGVSLPRRPSAQGGPPPPPSTRIEAAQRFENAVPPPGVGVDGRWEATATRDPGMGGAGKPMRPARSVRRPVGAAGAGSTSDRVSEEETSRSGQDHDPAERARARRDEVERDRKVAVVDAFRRAGGASRGSGKRSGAEDVGIAAGEGDDMDCESCV